MRKRGNKTSKKFSAKLIFAIISILIIILVISIYYKDKKDNTNQESNIPSTSFTKENFNYVNSQIADETQVKKECVYIRVGRCNAIGGVFGEGCWMRDVDIRFSGDSIPANQIQCTASTNLNSGPQTSGLEQTSENNIYSLKIKADMRQNNELTVCCTYSKTQEQLCLEKISIKGIC